MQIQTIVHALVHCWALVWMTIWMSHVITCKTCFKQHKEILRTQNVARRFYLFLWQPSPSKIPSCSARWSESWASFQLTQVHFCSIFYHHQILVFKPDLFSLLLCLSKEEVGWSRAYLLRVGLTRSFSFWSIFYTVCQNGQVGCCLFHMEQRTRNAQRNLKPMQVYFPELRIIELCLVFNFNILYLQEIPWNNVKSRTLFDK